MNTADTVHTTSQKDQGKNSYSHEELLACSRGELFGAARCRLPSPNMLMMDRIVDINATGGASEKGEVIAELDVHEKLWFFDCHFAGDPVMPGCLGLDALWQIVGFYLGWSGGLGKGRALGVGQVKFTGQVLPDAKKVTYRVEMKRVILRRLVMGIADGIVEVDGRKIYTAEHLSVGLSLDTSGF